MHKRFFTGAVMLMLLFCMPSAVYAVSSYKTVTASVPVSFLSSGLTENGTAVMETANDAPLPHESEITITPGGTEAFVIDIDEPGTFRYKVYQKNGGIDKIAYDDSVYTVTLFVTLNPDDTLKYAVVAASNDTMQKPDSIEFKNKIKNEGENDNNNKGGKDSDEDGKNKGDESSDSAGGARTRRGSGTSSSLNKNNDIPTEKTSSGEYRTENASKTEDIGESGSKDENSANDPANGQNGNNGQTSSENETSENIGSVGTVGTGGDTNGGTPVSDNDITVETAVNTGDSSRQSLWLAVMGISLAVILLSFAAENYEKKMRNV